MKTVNNFLSTLGKYKLQKELGKGGFGTVYLATDSIERKVAVKVLKPGFVDDADVIARFKREALAAGSLFHPHIATILDLDEADGRIFLVMRYIEGKSLDVILKERQKLPLDEVIPIMQQVGEGLQFAHDKGFIHRDIKPANIIISPTEGAVLTDFGLVKAVTSSGLSTTSVLLGTPAYMAPEVWAGQKASPATDVYSLGCMFYEMLTGSVLFDGESTPEIMKKHFDPVKIVESEIPVLIRTVLTRALSKDSKDRYQQVKSLIDDLSATENLGQKKVTSSNEVKQITPLLFNKEFFSWKRFIKIIGVIAISSGVYIELVNLGIIRSGSLDLYYLIILLLIGFGLIWIIEKIIEKRNS